MKQKLLTFIITFSLFAPVMAYATFPTVETTSDGNGSSLTLPSSIAVGDLVVVLTYSTSAITTPTGWTQFATQTNSPTIFTGLYFIATSTNTAYELPNTLTYNAYRISNYNGSNAPEATLDTQEAGSAGDPPNHTTSWGATDTLWIAGMVRNTVFEADCATGYANKVYNGDTGEVNSCRKTANASADNPSSLSSANNGGDKVSFTIAVNGGVPASSGNTMLMGMTF